MCSASAILIFESSKTLDQDIEYFTHQNDPSSHYKLPKISMGTIPIVVMVITIRKFRFLFLKKNIIISFKVTDSILFVLCYRMKDPIMYALAMDNRNDVASNAVALVCGLIGMIHFYLIH
jgi:hypothetical protein